MLGAARAAQVLGEAPVDLLQLLLERAFEQRVLAGGEVAHGGRASEVWGSRAPGPLTPWCAAAPRLALSRVKGRSLQCHAR
jgi:hypothetical protein